MVDQRPEAMEQWQDATLAGDRAPQEIQERIDEDKCKVEPYQKKRSI
jgi:hypothetical protein